MKTKLSILLIILTFGFGQSLSYYINEVKLGNFESVKNRLSIIERSYSNDPSFLYLKGLLETDSERAIHYYNSLIENHPDDDYCDDSLMKIGEYYYVSGLYVKASEVFKIIISEHSDYYDIHRTLDLYLKSLTISGSIDSVRYYTGIFKNRFPDFKIGEPIKFTPQSNAQVNAGVGYTVQIGIFSSNLNADRLSSRLNKNGFSARVEVIQSDDKLLYAVFVGNYNEENEARNMSRQINSQMNLDSFIIKR